MTKFTIPVKQSSFRKLDDPIENSISKKYIFYVNANDVPEGIPMATNPRDQNVNTSVAKAIRESLESNDTYFHLKNRGIVLSADTVNYNNQKEEVTITFTDDSIHGNVDGGHTYKIICESKGSVIDQFVQFEVMTGVGDIIGQLAEARNTSVQVDQKSMAELLKKFGPVKEALEGMPFFNRISFKQNQIEQDEETGKNLKMIDAREVVAIINMFYVNKYTRSNHPTQAYSSKEMMLKMYLQDPDEYKKYVNIVPDIFDLYDAVETEFADSYNNGGGRYGRKKYSGYKDGKIVTKSKFTMNDMVYRIPDGLVYPVVAAFRSMVDFNSITEKYEWVNGLSPIEVWSRCKDELTSKLMNFASAVGDNPNTVGKDANVWDLAYMTVERYLNN